MSAETDIAAIDDGGANTAAEVRTALESVLAVTPEWSRYLTQRLPGETSHADDDFFTSDTTANYTSIAPTGTVTPAVGKGQMSVFANGVSAGDYPVVVKALTSPSAPMTIETAITLIGDSGSFYVGCAFTDGTAVTSNTFQAHAFNSSGFGVGTAHGTVTNVTTFANNFANVTPQGGNILYVRLAWKAANTFKFAVSPNAVQWVDMGGVDITKAMTPTHAGFMVSPIGSSSELLATYHYLRVYNSDVVTSVVVA